MTIDNARITLQRKMIWRILGGARLQGLAATFSLFAAFRVIVVIVRGRSAAELGLTALVLLVLVATVVAGALGYAQADPTGIRWRSYLLTRRYAWSEIEQISLVIKSTGRNVRHLVLVRLTHSRVRRKITPVTLSGRERLVFGRELLAMAAAHGVAVQDDWLG